MTPTSSGHAVQHAAANSPAQRLPVALRPKYAIATTVAAANDSESATPKSHATCSLSPAPMPRYASIGSAHTSGQPKTAAPPLGIQRMSTQSAGPNADNAAGTSHA